MANILANLQEQSQENRSLDDIANYIANAIYNAPENLHSAILDGVAQEAVALIQEPVVSLQENRVQEKAEESGYFASLYNRAYNYLTSWIY